MHAVQSLYQYRKNLSTKPFNARGKQIKRCENCRLALQHCICPYRPVSLTAPSSAAFLLLMYDFEVLKPSNTGRLIADIMTDTHAFIWSRTTVDSAVLDLLKQPQYSPIVIFPQQYANDGQDVYENTIICPTMTRTNLTADTTKRSLPSQLNSNNKIPLFILLDGTWKEAKKMFRKSPYLSQLPILSLNQESSPTNIQNSASNYHLRNSSNHDHLATAEVAAQALLSIGDHHHAQLLQYWFELFSFHYQKSVSQKNLGCSDALQRLQDFINSRDHTFAKC